MNTEFSLPVPTTLSSLVLKFSDDHLVSLSLEPKSVSLSILNHNTDKKIIQNTLEQIEHYFLFSNPFPLLALEPIGTVFQKAVWSELKKIPLGETRTYGEVAKVLNSSARAVGNACRKNPIQIIVPCHRVISAKGLGGYAGQTDGRQMDIKRWLLKHEGALA